MASQQERAAQAARARENILGLHWVKELEKDKNKERRKQDKFLREEAEKKALDGKSKSTGSLPSLTSGPAKKKLDNLIRDASFPSGVLEVRTRFVAFETACKAVKGGADPDMLPGPGGASPKSTPTPKNASPQKQVKLSQENLKFLPGIAETRAKLKVFQMIASFPEYTKELETAMNEHDDSSDLR